MTWVKIEDRKPRHNQWVVVPHGDGFKAGQFDSKHPFSPAIVDRMADRFYNGFTHWKTLTAPKEKP